MISLISALLTLLTVTIYFVYCRGKALKYQEDSVRLMEEYFSDNSVPRKDKDVLYRRYLRYRRWYSFPALAIATPFMLLHLLFRNGNLSLPSVSMANEKLHIEALDKILRMVVSKNPILSILSIAIIGLSFSLIIPIGIVFNRATTIPAPQQMSQFLDFVSEKSHLH